ncbi:uncharacterized protein LOC117065096 [Trachypithecus francoisi]|uniref:uncharacterized protein LOC117065096 n=1 Tax=Trachypithecus francoisi TaxID=54180 RepID=UPI00141B6122|nr:uncharacterized protein LOC117065096 [Trachypithecus francoisi]
MRRAPDWVQREAAPGNKCRVSWQRREFPGQGGRKQHPPGSRQRKQNPISLTGEQNGRKATTMKGRWVPWESEESLLFASRRGLEGAEGAEDRPSAAPRGRRRRAQLTSAAQRSGLPSQPPPLSPLRKPGGSNQPRSAAAIGTQEACLEVSGTTRDWKYHVLSFRLDPRSGHAGSALKAGGCSRLGGGGRGRGEAGAPSPF